MYHENVIFIVYANVQSTERNMFVHNKQLCDIAVTKMLNAVIFAWQHLKLILPHAIEMRIYPLHNY